MNDNLNRSMHHDNIGNNDTLNDVYSPSVHNSTPGSITSNEKLCNSSVSKISEQSQNSDSNNNHITDYSADNLEKTLTEESKSKLNINFQSIQGMKNSEKLLLLIKMMDNVDDSEYNSYELNKTFDAGINQAEHNGALNWVVTHLEEDEKTCLRKEDVYKNYKDYCERSMIRVLTSADFGKVMRKVFPNIKPRRLGARGQSKYCYSGLRMSKSCSMNVYIADENENDTVIKTSKPQDLTFIPHFNISHDIASECGIVLVEYFRNKLNKSDIGSVKDICKFLISNNEVDRTTSHANKLMHSFQVGNVTDAASHDYSSVSSTGSSSQIVSVKKECVVDSPKSNTSSVPVRNKSNPSSNFPITAAATTNYQSSGLSNTYQQPIALTTHTNQQYPMNYTNTHAYNRSSASNSSQFTNSPTNYMPSLKPNTAPYPNPNAHNVDYPVLNSSLLDNSPSTSKRLKLNSHNLPPGNTTSQYMPSNQSQRFTGSPYHHNLSQVQSPISQQHTPYYPSTPQHHQQMMDPRISNLSPGHLMSSFSESVASSHTPRQDRKSMNYCNVQVLRPEEPCSPLDPSYVVDRQNKILPNYELFRSNNGLEVASNVSEDPDQDELNTPRNSPGALNNTSGSTTPTSHPIIDKLKTNILNSSCSSDNNALSTHPTNNNSNNHSSDKNDNNNAGNGRCNEFNNSTILNMENLTSQTSTSSSVFLPHSNLNSMSISSSLQLPHPSQTSQHSNLAAFMAQSPYTNPYNMPHPSSDSQGMNYMHNLTTVPNSSTAIRAPTTTPDNNNAASLNHHTSSFDSNNNDRSISAALSVGAFDYSALSRLYGYTFPTPNSYEHQLHQSSSSSFNKLQSVTTSKLSQSPGGNPHNHSNNEEFSVSSTTGQKLSLEAEDEDIGVATTTQKSIKFHQLPDNIPNQQSQQHSTSNTTNLSESRFLQI